MLSRCMPLTRVCFAFSCSDGIFMVMGAMFGFGQGAVVYGHPGAVAVKVCRGRDSLGDVMGKSVL